MSFRLSDGTKIKTSLRLSDQNIKSIHILPTQLLLTLHSRVEETHFYDQRNENLRRLHTIVANEMVIRNLDHFDSEDFDWIPLDISLPTEALEYDILEQKFKIYSKKVT